MDVLDFKRISGNEILLHLENAENLRPSELCSALIELHKREITSKKEIDWNNHEWLKKVVLLIKKRVN